MHTCEPTLRDRSVDAVETSRSQFPSLDELGTPTKQEGQALLFGQNSPRCQTILIRSPLAPLKTYKLPACGSRPSTNSTRLPSMPNAAHSVKPFRLPVALFTSMGSIVVLAE